MSARRSGLAPVLLAALAGCTELLASPDAEVVARVNGEEVLLAEVVQGRPPAAHGELARRVEQQVVDVLVAQEARRRGLADRPAIRDRLVTIRTEAHRREIALLREAFIEDLRGKLWIDEDDTRAYFETHKERFGREFLTFRIAKLESEGAAQALEARLAGAGDGLASVAEAKLVGPLQRINVPEHFQRVLADLATPGARGLAQARGEWFLLELVARDHELPADVTAVRGRIERILRSERVQQVFQEQVERLRERADITVNEDLLRDGDA